MSLPRELLRAMTITGGAQAVGIVVSIVRMKAFALLLGPAGVGVLSLYNSLLATASSLAGLGLGGSGVREIAQASEDPAVLGRVRRVLLAASLVQGLIAMLAIWLLRERIGQWLFGMPDYGFEVGLVGIAVLLSLLGASQTALLRGLRRVGELGWITVFGALAATMGGIAAVWFLGVDGLIWFVLLQPLSAVLVAAWYTGRLPETDTPPLGMAQVWRIWKPMVRLGASFMLAGMSTSLALLLANWRVADQLGLDAAGQLAAASSITITYIGFLLNAMGMDYYPRLAGIIEDRGAASRLINEQLQLGLMIGTPILLLLIGLAPLAITILYSSEFTHAATLVQWQVVGILIQLCSAPLGYALVAGARSGLYLASQLLWNVVFLLLLWVGIERCGIESAGVAFLAAHLVLLGFTWAVVARLGQFRCERTSGWMMAGSCAIALALLALVFTNPIAGGIAAAAAFLASGFAGGHRLLERIGPDPRTEPLLRFYRHCGWPVEDRR